MKKICFVVTNPSVIHLFLRPIILECYQSFSITVICNSHELFLIKDLPIKIIVLPIMRKPDPIRDLYVFMRLIILFYTEHFTLIHSHTPKGGFLGILAASFCGVEIRVHTFHGEVWSTKKFLIRFFLKKIDTLVALFGTHLLSVSKSHMEFLISSGIVKSNKIKVLGEGSACGVNPLRFHPNSDARFRLRLSLSIPNNAKVIIYLGRLTYEKGLKELSLALEKIMNTRHDVYVIFVGHNEGFTSIDFFKYCPSGIGRSFFIPFTMNSEDYICAADILTLPSYREGFGMVVIEAAFCAVPAVASSIPGLSDTIVNGKTGILVPAYNVHRLLNGLLELVDNDYLRYKMGNAARKRALLFFSEKKISKQLLSFYQSIV